MRIICPGCRAEYAIPDAAIPEAGREVQCAACTHAWYQLPLPPARDGAGAAPAASEDARTATRPAAPDAGPHAEARIQRLRAAMSDAAQAVPPSPAPGSVARAGAGLAPPPDPAAARTSPPIAPARRPAPAGAEDTDEETAATDPAPEPPPLPTPEPAARRIDPDVLRILREEAAIEVRARTGAAPPVAAQRSPAQERLARLQAAERGGAPLGPADGEAAVEDPDAARRQPRPPLIAAANPGAEPQAGIGWRDQPLARPRSEGRRDLMVRQNPGQLALVQAAQRRRGFRVGYAATAGLCCALLALYVSAPVFAQWLPAGTPLAEVVIDHGDRVHAAVVDALRSMLEKQPGAS